jgi:hypothetical protein
MCATYFEIGRMIVEERSGKARAKYGKKLLACLSDSRKNNGRKPKIESVKEANRNGTSSD